MLKTLTLITSLAPAILLGQSLDLIAVNTAFHGAVVFKLDKHDQLVMDFMDGTNRYRQDIAPILHLDPGTIHFSSEEDAIVLECSAANSKCFTKEIFKLDVVRITGRSTLPRPANDPEGVATIAILRELLAEAALELNGSANETAPEPARMKGH